MDNFYYVKHMLQTIQYTIKFNDHFTNLYQSSIRSDLETSNQCSQ